MTQYLKFVYIKQSKSLNNFSPYNLQYNRKQSKERKTTKNYIYSNSILLRIYNREHIIYKYFLESILFYGAWCGISNSVESSKMNSFNFILSFYCVFLFLDQVLAVVFASANHIESSCAIYLPVICFFFSLPYKNR